MIKKQVIRKNAMIPTALISGGAGFIGSHLAEILLENKARVIVLDNFKTGKEIHVKHLINNKNFALYDVDINQGIPKDIESVDYIFHLAGLEEYLYSKDFVTLDSLLTNSLGTKNLLDLAKKSDAKFLLASTIDVYQGKMSQLYLQKYFGEKSEEENKFSLIEAKRFAEAVVWEYFKTYDIDARIVRLPEVYGPRMDLSSSGNLGEFVKSLIDGKPLSIYGEGVESEYYIHVDDVVSGLVKAQFNNKTKGNIYSLVPKDAISVLELAYLVKSLADGQVSVQFKPSKGEIRSRVFNPDEFNLKDLNWKPKVVLKDGLSLTLKWFGYSTNEFAFKPNKYVEMKKAEIKPLKKDQVVTLQGLASPKTPIKIEKPISLIMPFKESKKTSISWVGLKNNINDFLRSLKFEVGVGASVFAVLISALTVFIGIPVTSMYLNSRKGASSLLGVQKSISSFDTESMRSLALVSENKFSGSRNSLHKIKWVFSLLGKKSQYNSYDHLLASLINFSKAMQSTASVAQPVEGLWDIIKPDTQNIINPSQFTQASSEIISAKNYMRLAEADSVGVEQDHFPKFLKDDFEKYTKAIYEIQNYLALLSPIIPDLPDVLGSSNSKKYLVWFQNSNEIRPTGGFIGSYGVITLDKGKITNLVIDDIYNPDGQIDLRNINVDPPAEIKEALGEDRLYLRNSNWDPDFTKSVIAFDNLYFKVTGEKIDGYIAIDLDFVEKLLRVTGPIFLAAYNEEISADNLDERAQFYSSFDYKEGSSDKRSFLTVLGGKLLERVFSLTKSDIASLSYEVGRSLEERHLMLHFRNSTINSVLKDLGWDGGIKSTTGDYIYVVNANLGGTKANYHVKNKMTYEVNSLTRDGLLRADLYLDYTHTAESNAWPSGPYKDYVRVLTQKGSKLTGAKILIGKSEEDIFNNIKILSTPTNEIYETSFVLDPSQSVRLVFSYDLPQYLSLSKSKAEYKLLWQKQPGTSNDEYFFTFNPPFGMSIKDISDESFKSSGVMDTDKTFSFSMY